MSAPFGAYIGRVDGLGSTMGNEYASNFGDVVKHAVLSTAIEHERPVRYLESHGGRLTYDLAGLTPGRGGVWDFLDVAAQDPALQASAYAKLLRSLAGTADEPGIYPGSVALADALLPTGAEVLAFDLVDSSAVSLREVGSPRAARDRDGRRRNPGRPRCGDTGRSRPPRPLPRHRRRRRRPQLR